MCSTLRRQPRFTQPVEEIGNEARAASSAPPLLSSRPTRSRTYDWVPEGPRGAIPELTTLSIFSIELVAARIGHYLLTIGKGNSLCYHPSIPARLEEWVFAHYLRPHSFSFFPPPKLHNTIRSLTKFKQLARTRYKCAVQCQTVSDFIWRIRVYYTRHFLCIRAELSIIEATCLRPRQDASKCTDHDTRHHCVLPQSYYVLVQFGLATGQLNSDQLTS